MAKVQVTLREGLRAEVKVRQHTIFADEPAEDGGTDSGPMPTELVLGALAACAAITAQLYARRKGWPLESIEIEADTERRSIADDPMYRKDGSTAGDIVNEFTQVMRFNGDLTPDQKKRLLEIAGRCPVHRLFTQPSVLIERLAEEAVEAALSEEEQPR